MKYCKNCRFLSFSHCHNENSKSTHDHPVSGKFYTYELAVNMRDIGGKCQGKDPAHFQPKLIKRTFIKIVSIFKK